MHHHCNHCQKKNWTKTDGSGRSHSMQQHVCFFSGARERSQKPSHDDFVVTRNRRRKKPKSTLYTPFPSSLLLVCYSWVFLPCEVRILSASPLTPMRVLSDINSNHALDVVVPWVVLPYYAKRWVWDGMVFVSLPPCSYRHVPHVICESTACACFSSFSCCITPSFLVRLALGQITRTLWEVFERL